MLEYDSIAAICEAAEQQQVTISALVLSDQAEQTEMPEEALYERMKNSLYVMQEAVREGKNPDLRSTSGLTGGDAARMEAYAAGGGITGTFLNHAMARAVAVSEYNAAMGRIVAAPTAGSCGILPGTVVTMLEEGRCDEHAAVMALFTAGAIGMVIAQKASIAGAQGGCLHRRHMPAPWPLRTSWAWYAIRWQGLWRFPVLNGMYRAPPLHLPLRRWRWQA